MLKKVTLAAGLIAAAALFGVANAAPLTMGGTLLTTAEGTILVPAKVKKGAKAMGKGKGMGKGHAHHHHRHRHRHGRDVGIGIGLGIFGAILCAEAGNC